MKIKNYDEKSKKWIITASNEADSIELNNPSFGTGGSISVSEAFTEVGDRLTTLEQNVIWLYKNKGTGSGSGGSGGGSSSGSSYSITVMNGDTVYTSTSTVSLDLLINSNGVKKSFTVTAKNGNKVIGTYKVYSMTQTTITLTGLDGTANIEISAYDSDNIYAVPVYIKVIAGAIKVEIDTVPSKTMYMGGTSEVALNYTVTNSITGSPAEFILTINNIEVARESNITTALRSIYYNARTLIFDSGLFNPRSGQKFSFKAYATTSLNNESLTSNTVSFDITVADSYNLVIVTDDITEDEPTEENIVDLTSFNQGSQLAFDYYLSCGLTTYPTFNVEFTVDLMQLGVEDPIETLTKGTKTNINKNTTERFNLSTVEYEPTEDNQYLRVTLFGSAVNDPTDTKAQYTKYVYCVIKEVQSVDLYANNDMQTLLCYFSRVTGFPVDTTEPWTYQLKTSGQFQYNGAFKSKFPEGITLTPYKVNGKTSGFVDVGEGSAVNKAIAFAGESYGVLNIGEKLFPDLEISAGASIFTKSGFNISTTFKTNENGSEDDVVLSLGKYEEGELSTGYEIKSQLATCKVGSSGTITCKLPESTLVTVDLDVSFMNKGWYFRMYINGVLSAVMRVTDDDLDWTFGTDLYLAARYDSGNTSNYCGVKFYDFKIYTSSQSEYAITQNYISATLQAQLLNNAVNPTLDSELRIKNLFDSAGNCIIWDKDLNSGKGDYLSGDQLYNKLIDQMEINTPYPLVLIEETSLSSTNFEPYSTAVFSAANKNTVMNATFGCKITYQDANGKAIISTPDGVSSANGVRVGLQGTSSLSYNSKNYEIYLGNKDASGNPLLFTPNDEWLPENEFTLKADVMDSAHVNNVVIGKIVNGWATGADGSTIKPFNATPPMELSNAVWGGEEQASKVRDKFKHTSEGFPVLLFIRYAPDKDGNTQQAQFMGIYNFNLGRYAYNNLGLKLLLDYEKDNVDGPSLVSNYILKADYWNSGTAEGVYSMEINQNSSSQGAFQQDDSKIIQFMADVAYTSRDDQAAYNKVQEFYTQMANMALGNVPKYTMDDNNKTFVLKGGSYILDKNGYYNFDACDKYLDWNNAMSYYVLALVFGMVDSMCKNLTIRNWGGTQWYTCFYDMDTAFGLNNSGQDIVEYYAHLHRWYNINNEKTGLTESAQIKNYSSDDDAVGEAKQYFASWWNRIWEVLENLGQIDSTNEGDRLTIEKAYVNLRNNLFPDPEQFINDYYKSYTEATGSIVFNYDYRTKYLKVSKTYNMDTGEYTEDYEDFSQLGFLHGNRVIHVKDWFKKRILFFDSIYGTGDQVINTSISTPVNQMWKDNKATGGTSTKIDVKMNASSKMLYQYEFDKTKSAFWLNEELSDMVHLAPNGETIIYMYANKYIKNINNFKQFAWTNLKNVDFPLMEEVDLSGLSNMDSDSFFTGGVYNKSSNTGLKSIKKLNLSNVKLIGSNASGYTLTLTDCDKLQELNISNSSITNIKYPTEATLKTLNLSGTNITKLELSDQSFLTSLNIDNCSKLTTVKISNCESLPYINIPSSVTRVEISNCKGLTSFNLPYTGNSNTASNLVYINIDNCPGLTTFNISGQNNPNLEIELTGAWNLEELNLTSVQYSKLLLPSKDLWTSLRTLAITNTSISSFEYNNSDNVDYLDLKHFPDLSSITAYSCNNLTKVVLANNIDNPIELGNNAFMNCSSLERVFGYISIEGTYVFDKCPKLIINDEQFYTNYTTSAGFVEGDDVLNIRFNTSIIDNCFNACTSLTTDDFGYIIRKFNDKITSAKNLFSGCKSVAAFVWDDMLSRVPNLEDATGMFKGTSIGGIIRSYNTKLNKNGFLDYIPNCLNFTDMFANSMIQYIDNNLFAYRNGQALKVVEIKNMFSGCSSLQACADTWSADLALQPLDSKTFFINLDNLKTTYPEGVFTGSGIKMQINTDDKGNTYLFHVKKKPAGNLSITSAIYDGIDLIGEIGVNVFGGITDEVDGYYIPTFQAINYPFGTNPQNAEINLGACSKIFDKISDVLKTATGVFSGLKLIGDKTIPSDLFNNCSALTNISEIFANLEFDYGDKEFEFPVKGLFDSCDNLQNISGIIKNCYKNRIKLIGGQFKNCRLTDVSNAFNNSGIYGFVPYKLFYMAGSDGQIRQTIEKMSGVFSACYYLGYDKTRELYDTVILNGLSSDVQSRHVVKTQGNKLNFKLEEVDLEDSWCLDGYYRENTLTAEYTQYDKKQAECITAQADTGNYIETYQNYIVPTDIFRYCSSKCELDNILSALNWNKVVLGETEDGMDAITTTDEIEGCEGRIPMRIFESLTTTQSLKNVFNGLNYTPFVGLISTLKTTERGMMYPPDLFKYNVELTDVTGCLSNKEIPVGVDINSNLFENNLKLKTISGLWQNCDFDGRELNNSSYTDYYVYPQITWSMFDNNDKLSDCSSLFAKTNQEKGVGLRVIDSTLFSNNPQIANISNMFYGNINMKGSVPLFRKTSYPFRNSVDGYIKNTNKNNITNFDALAEDQALIPEEWRES